MTIRVSARKPKTAAPALTASATIDPPELLKAAVILLQVQALVEFVDGRGVVLDLLNVVRGLVDEFSRLLSKRRDRGSDERAQKRKKDDEHQCRCCPDREQSALDRA